MLILNPLYCTITLHPISQPLLVFNFACLVTLHMSFTHPSASFCPSYKQSTEQQHQVNCTDKYVWPSNIPGAKLFCPYPMSSPKKASPLWWKVKCLEFKQSWSIGSTSYMVKDHFVLDSYVVYSKVSVFLPTLHSNMESYDDWVAI